MEREFLVSLGLEEETVETILAECGRIEDEAAERENRQRKEAAIDEELKKLGAKNLTAVKALLNTDEVTLTENGLEGFDAQIEEIMRENDFLFDNETTPRVVGPSSSRGRGFGFNFTGVR